MSLISNKIERFSLKKEVIPIINEDNSVKSPIIFKFEEIQQTTQNRLTLFRKRTNESKISAKPTAINILYRLTSILKVINLLRMRTFYRPMKYINDNQIEMINDQTCFSRKKQEKDVFFRQYTEKNVKYFFSFLF